MLQANSKQLIFYSFLKKRNLDLILFLQLFSLIDHYLGDQLKNHFTTQGFDHKTTR